MMHGGMQYDPIQGHCHESLTVANPIFKSYLLGYLQGELATGHWFLNYGTISKVVPDGFFISVLVFVSRDKLETQLQWSTNRKSYVAHRTAPLPMPLNDFEGTIAVWNLTRIPWET